MTRARAVLTAAVALLMVTETALTPYWPAMFRELFDVDTLATTGMFLTVCRVAALVAMPLWGLAALRWPVGRLLVVGLAASTVLDLALAFAPSVTAFTATAAAAVAAGSSLVLAYPALVSVLERHTGAGSGRVAGVVAFAMVFHASAVLATVVGGAVVTLPQPRAGLAAFAALDLVLAALVWWTVPVERDERPAGVPAPEGRPTAVWRAPLVPVLAVAALAVLVDLAAAVPRPFLVELLLAERVPLALAGAQFLLPSLAALAVLPLAGHLVTGLGSRLLPLAALAAAAGLAVQASAPASLPAMTAGRVLLGLGLGLALVAVDLRVFAVVGTAGPGFSAVETGRSAALLAGPLVATAAATVSLSLPLLVGALLFVAAAAAGPLTAFRTRSADAPRPSATSPVTDSQEVPVVLDTH